jgi:hypothetical protein
VGKIKYAAIDETDGVTLHPYEIKDPKLAEPLTGTFHGLDSFEQDAALEAAEELVRMYVTGGFIHPVTGQWTPKPMVAPTVAGRKPKLNRTSLELICRIAAMTDHLPEEERLTADDLIELPLRAKAAWLALQQHASRCQYEYDQGKDA